MKKIYLVAAVVFGSLIGSNLAKAEKSLTGKLLQKNIYNVSVSADGKMLAYIDNLELWTASVDGKITKKIYGSKFSHPSWSPDGKKMAVLENPGMNIYVIDADGNGPRHITSKASEFGGLNWSPDGKRLIFIRDGSLMEVEDIRESKAKAIKLTDAVDLEPESVRISPDGKHLAIKSSRQNEAGRYEYDLSVFQIDGRGRKNIYKGNKGLWLAGWAPDSRTIYFTIADTIIEGDAISVNLKKSKIDRPKVVQVADIYGRDVIISRDGKKIFWLENLPQLPDQDAGYNDTGLMVSEMPKGK